VSLDPARAVDVVAGSAVALVYEGLLSFDAQGRLAPGLAAAWETPDGGRTWRFRLDPAARDSEGSPVGTAEVAASFRRLLDPATASPRAWVLERVRGARAFGAGEADSIEGLRVGDGTVEIELEAPSASFPSLLTMPSAAILPRGQDVSGRVATGPWVAVERVRDSHLRFARNPHWHGPRAAFEEIHVRVLPEELTRVAEFEVGHLDLLEIPAAESARFRGDVRFAPRIQRQVALAVEYVGLDCDDPVLRDPRVRRALNQAVNVELLLERVLGGRGVRAAGAIPPGLEGSGAAEPYRHDPDAARRALAECGVPAGWELPLWQRPSPLASQVLEAIQADLAAVGVRAVLRVRDWSALKAAIDRGETPAFFANWYADYPDPENFLVPLFHSRNVGGGGNRARFHDPEVDAALDALERAEGAERAARCAAIDRRVHEAAPWIYLWHPVTEVAVSPRVAGYRPHRVPTAERWLEVAPAAAAAERP
jgi:ABC-type transport system substrate-binding protein